MSNQPTKAQITQWHQLFLKLSEMTKDADNMLEIGQRFLDSGLIEENQEPSVAAWLFEDEAHEFSSALAQALWNPDQNPDWQNEKDSTKGKH